MKAFEHTETTLDSSLRVPGLKGLETSLQVVSVTRALVLRETQRARSTGQPAQRVTETGTYPGLSTGAHAPHAMEIETRLDPSIGVLALHATETAARPVLLTETHDQRVTVEGHQSAHLTGVPAHLETETAVLLTEKLALHVMETGILSTKSLSKATAFSMMTCQ
jgi:hypothetical protein